MSARCQVPCTWHTSLGTLHQPLYAITTMRLRLTFAKTPSMRFTGHMDLHRSLERTFRRAGLPLTHSQGFTKRPKMNLASALPLGVTGERELGDIWLDEDLPPVEVLKRIRAACPPGIDVHAVEELAEDAPKLQNVVAASDFIVTLLVDLDDLQGRVDGLLGSEEILRTRRKKNYDLRPLILELKVIELDEDGRQRLAMKLKTREGETGRADEVVAALGGDPFDARVHRITIHLDLPQSA